MPPSGAICGGTRWPVVRCCLSHVSSDETDRNRIRSAYAAITVAGDKAFLRGSRLRRCRTLQMIRHHAEHRSHRLPDRLLA